MVGPGGYQRELCMETFLPPTPQEVPDIYADSTRIWINLFGFTFEMGIQGIPNAPGSEPPPIKTLMRIRMSPQHAYVFMKVLRKNIDAYRDKIGPIIIPDQIFKELDIPKED